MNREAVNLAKAALELMRVAVIDEKQLEGELGLADEATDDYRDELILILLLWASRNASVKLSDRLAVNLALDGLRADLEALGARELPKAFRLGFGKRPDAAQAVALDTALLSNSDFIMGSLIPYMEVELVETEVLAATIGDVALARAAAWETRVGLYAGTYWTAIWEGVGEALRDRLDLETVPVRRLLDPGAQHCNTCPGKALEYGSWNEMLGFTGGLPADGSDDCHSNCRCQIELFIEGEWVGVA